MLGLIVRLMHMLHDRLNSHVVKLAAKADAASVRYYAATDLHLEAQKFLGGVKTLLGR